ncbi:N-lysine methyltransferase KMT5A [Triplophysa tibetana]|uniref:N-lysine methyltransferase KMT5A n=1 Tax=Triplophysa tibetana TaxID=1572043 RepID=A0A5A9NQT0_9TELE|nr:N-lysine methyltransferase KMT5A [Triplophysa tibetana]
MAPKREKDRRIITCLQCFKPQEVLPNHLLRVCMKGQTDEERKAEVDRAKTSMKAWTLRGRTWDYNAMVKRYPDEASRQALLEELRERHFLILNDPKDAQAESSHRPPDAAKHAQSTLEDCQRVLRASQEDMFGIHRKLMDQQHVEEEQRTMFRYFCEAILVLIYFQRPEAVRAFTASDWINKTNVDGRIHMELQSTKQSATLSLTEEDSAMLETYFTKIRPECLQESVDDQGRFFLSKQGLPVVNVTSDLRRLHEQYDLPSFSSQQARRAQSTMPCSSSDEPANERRVRKQKRGRGAADQADRDFGAFLLQFPATASSSPPTKKKRTAAGFPPDRVFYDRWRAVQLAKREEHLLSQCSRRPPTISKVSLLIKKEVWTGNCPRPKDVVAKWKPFTRMQVESDPWIITTIQNQKWTGLALKDFGTKGQGVVATKAFAMGSIVCDYHGKVITGAEGRKLVQTIKGDMGYLFFFHAAGRDLCVDAETFPCECHPTENSMGRKINHSSKRANLSPVHCMMNFPEGQRDVILFQAKRDIRLCEELLFDYGVKRKSFRGEAMTLDWLDD